MAAFVKRLCRLCLTSPVDGLSVVIPLIYNLILRHEACSVLLHRPGVSGMFSQFSTHDSEPESANALYDIPTDSQLF